jgi:hypothetical protein
MITEWWVGGLETTTTTCDIGSGLVCMCIDNALDKRRFLKFMETRERALAMAQIRGETARRDFALCCFERLCYCHETRIRAGVEAKHDLNRINGELNVVP